MWLVIFLLVLVFNLAPAFTPPTWLLLAYIQVTFHTNPFALALVGALAATSGRLILARLSDVIIRQRFLSEKTIKNIDAVQAKILKRKRLTVGIFFFYALSPLPSNQLFMAYGLTNLGPGLIAVPFLVGRFVSYFFWTGTASIIVQQVAANAFQSGAFLGSYFIIAQSFTLLTVYLFAKIDWQKLFTEKKIGWVK